MNDSELDEVLDQWDAPGPRAELRESVRARFATLNERPPKKGRAWLAWFAPSATKGLLAGAAAGAVVFLAVIGQAFPQSFGLGSPSPALRSGYAVISNVVVYARDGSSRIEANVISHNYKGTEIVIAESDPGNTVTGFIKSVHTGVHYLLLRYVPNLVLPESSERDAWFSAYVQSGCVDKGEIQVGQETILDHATNVLQQTYPDGSRWTAWRAPDLGCFALRWKSEEPIPGGGLRLVRQRDAEKVLGRPRSQGSVSSR
jgi:hypothetical protein